MVERRPRFASPTLPFSNQQRCMHLSWSPLLGNVGVAGVIIPPGQRKRKGRVCGPVGSGGDVSWLLRCCGFFGTANVQSFSVVVSCHECKQIRKKLNQTGVW